MESLRIKTDASVIDDKVGIGYVLYSRENDNYSEILRNSQQLEAPYNSQKAEEVAILRGLSVAQKYYTGGTVATLTDCKGIVDRVENRGIFSHDKKIRRSLSNITNEFDQVIIKWIPAEENQVAHNACRSAIKD